MPGARSRRTAPTKGSHGGASRCPHASWARVQAKASTQLHAPSQKQRALPGTPRRRRRRRGRPAERNPTARAPGTGPPPRPGGATSEARASSGRATRCLSRAETYAPGTPPATPPCSTSTGSTTMQQRERHHRAPGGPGTGPRPDGNRHRHEGRHRRPVRHEHDRHGFVADDGLDEATSSQARPKNADRRLELVVAAPRGRGSRRAAGTRSRPRRRPWSAAEGELPRRPATTAAWTHRQTTKTVMGHTSQPSSWARCAVRTTTGFPCPCSAVAGVVRVVRVVGGAGVVGVVVRPAVVVPPSSSVPPSSVPSSLSSSLSSSSASPSAPPGS